MQRRDFVRAAMALPASGSVPLSAAAGLRGQLKIGAIETDVLRFPPGRRYSDAIHDFGSEGGALVLRVRTDAGITGWAESHFGMIGGGPRVLESMLHNEVAPVLAGQDPSFPKQIRRDLWRALEYRGVQGLAQFAMAAVDIA